jgi:hypothetical protein
MSPAYDRRQDAGQWPRRGRWNPNDLPADYLGLLHHLCGSLTRWRDDDGDERRIDPRCDPRIARATRDRHPEPGRPGR